MSTTHDATKGGSKPSHDSMKPANSADVMNQTILPLNCSTWWFMDEDCVHDMNVIQMTYAQAVSAAANTAYSSILKALEENKKRGRT